MPGRLTKLIATRQCGSDPEGKDTDPLLKPWEPTIALWPFPPPLGFPALGFAIVHYLPLPEPTSSWSSTAGSFSYAAAAPPALQAGTASAAGPPPPVFPPPVHHLRLFISHSDTVLLDSPPYIYIIPTPDLVSQLSHSSMPYLSPDSPICRSLAHCLCL